MKTCLLYAFLFLVLLGTTPASGNTNKKGVSVVDGPEESFLRRITMDDDIHNRNAIIELHLTSIDVLVSVRVDTINNITSITIAHLSGKDARNETEPEKENEKEQFPTNKPKNASFTNTSLPVPNTSPTQQINHRETTSNSSTWLDKAWDSFSSAMQLCIKWLRGGVERPKDIDLTCPADGSVNHSMFDLDITDMEEKTCPVTSSIPLMTLTDINPWSQNVATEDSEVTAKQTPNTTLSALTLENENSHGSENTATVKEKESIKRREPFVVFMGHYDSEDEPAELLPEFTTLNYFGSNPDIMSASTVQRENEDSMLLDGLDTVDLDDEDDYIYGWPETLPEFATVGYYGMVPSKAASENHEYTDNARPSKENLTTKDSVSREVSVEENHSNENGESWPLKNSEIATPVVVDERNASTPQDKGTSMDFVDARNHTTYHEGGNECIEDVPVSAETEIQSNGTVRNEYSMMCPIQPVDAGNWMRDNDHGVCIKDDKSVHLGISDTTSLISHGDTPLQAIPLKRAKDKWMGKILIDESALCLAGTNKSGPETKYCSRNASRSSSDTTWFITKLWNRCMALKGWRKSSGVPLQATQVNKAQDKLISQVPVCVFEICMAGSNKSGPETEFCTKKAARRSADTTRFTTKLWNRGVAAVRWLKSNETHDKARNMTNYYWTRFQIMMINWTWQDTFKVMIIIGFCFMALYLTIRHIKETRLLRLQRELQTLHERELEEERERERERLRELKLERERAAQTKPWQPKPPKKKRPNYCGRLQKWH